MSARYRPLENCAADAAGASSPACAAACPRVPGEGDEREPGHHDERRQDSHASGGAWPPQARRPHDKSDPIWEILGNPPDALSMKSPAFMIASSSASAHNAARS